MMLRQIEAERKFCQHIDLAALQQVISTDTIRAVLQQCGKQAKRERKLCQEAVVWLLIASTLLSPLSLGLVPPARLGRQASAAAPQPVQPACG